MYILNGDDTSTFSFEDALALVETTELELA